eukprot:GDKI01029569.1.p1 GENE.GDKI01029569.1~~GDKI01029569.1.p1  ORF type:complete len:503 (+),score=99.19 GDKI01029569.1:56-1564(+)
MLRLGLFLLCFAAAYADLLGLGSRNIRLPVLSPRTQQQTPPQRFSDATEVLQTELLPDRHTHNTHPPAVQPPMDAAEVPPANKNGGRNPVLGYVPNPVGKFSGPVGSTGPVVPIIPGGLTPQLARTIAAQQVCVGTPEEYVAAFANRDNRCVSNNLLFTVQGSTDTTSAVARLTQKVRTRAMLFWSDRQNGEKYMRIGYPLSIGNFIESVAPGFEQTYATATFSGSDGISNGQALMEDIGFPAEFSRIDSVYALAVVSRPPVTVTPLVYPTWGAVRDMWVWKILNDIHVDASEYLTDTLVHTLTHNTFQSLTHCPTTCAYADTHFPNIPSAVAPVVSGVRTSPDTCTCDNLPHDTSDTCGDRYHLTAPNSYDSASTYCDEQWLNYTADFAALTTTCNATSLQLAERELLQRFEAIARDSTLSVEEKNRQNALLFRAFVFTSCMGNMNDLFSGNGQTYTALGGLKSSTGSEVISSSFDLSQTNVQFIFFCLNGRQQPVNGTCV